MLVSKYTYFTWVWFSEVTFYDVFLTFRHQNRRILRGFACQRCHFTTCFEGFVFRKCNFTTCFWHLLFKKRVFYEGWLIRGVILRRVFDIPLSPSTYFTRVGLSGVSFYDVFLTLRCHNARILRGLAFQRCHFTTCFWHSCVWKHVFYEGWLVRGVILRRVFNI